MSRLQVVSGNEKVPPKEKRKKRQTIICKKKIIKDRVIRTPLKSVVNLDAPEG
jgi:hypothetical protein